MAIKRKSKPKAEPKEKLARKKNKESVSKQFQGLDMSDPGQWPFLPQLLICFIVVLFVVGVAWVMLLSSSYEALENGERQELQLKEDFLGKWRIAVNLESLQEKQTQVQQYVAQLEARLPSEAQLDSLLRDISSAAEGSGLSVEVLKAENVVTQDYYKEQPISIRMTGKSYHDFGKFAEALAVLERIVTLDSVTLEPIDAKLGEASGVKLQGTLRTYRYTNEEERANNRSQAQRPAQTRG
ncbi:MAG: type 4a pilus biogenesis protein PilO [Saezia sp.]